MPEGYYSGDKPNPHLREFVEQHIRENPFDAETDDYNVPAFDLAIETTKATAIYNMHTYWSKKPHDAIREYIRHYTTEGDLVLDPFCGSGGTALAALMEGRKAIAIDRSPAATFITKNYCTPVDVEELEAAFDELKAKVKPEIDWLYETVCDRCDGKATTGYTVYSQVFECGRCLERVPLFDCIEKQLPKGTKGGGKSGKQKLCPFCYKRNIEEPISSKGQGKLGAIPVLVSYICESNCKPARNERRHNDADKKKREYFAKYDLAKLKEIEEMEIPYWYPTTLFPRGDRYHRDGLKYNKINTAADLFTKRNLWALSIILNKAQHLKKTHRDLAIFALTGSMLHLSKMSHHKEGGGGIMVGTYYLPQHSKERNAFKNLSDKLREILLAIRQTSDINEEIYISTQSAVKISQLTTASIDYIFTDPPYADKVQYGELNFIWEAWLGFENNWYDEEIIVNEIRGKTETDWAQMIKASMQECYRVLKPGHWLSLCYHDTSEGTWESIQDAMAEIGFIAEVSDKALFITSKQKSFNQITADKVTKRDLVINFRKPKLGETTQAVLITGEEDTQTFAEKVHQIIRDYLTANPGATKDRVYDEVVSFMVRAGQMEAHNFDEILSQIAEPVRESENGENGAAVSRTAEAGRWYLKETEAAAIDQAESVKEDRAAANIGDFIKQYLADRRGTEGVHYSDIFEQYVYTVKDKPRRQLADWLPDYFYKTDAGTYRLPATQEEEQLKQESRASGANRRIKRYLSYIQQGLLIPDKERPNDTTLAEWIRMSKRSGMYEAGKLLYEKGGLNLDNLPETTMVNVEEDYETCVRMLTRNAAPPKAKRKSKKDS